MSQIVLLKLQRWENTVCVEYAQAIEKGDVVVVETAEGIVTAIVEDIFTDSGKNDRRKISSEFRIIRRANLNDIKVVKELRQKEKKALVICQKEVKKRGIPMKIVGAAYAFDGGSIIFAFIADGRIDFRDLVKDLSKVFQRSIRLQQIGARDEARVAGGFGICGRELCCIRFKENLPSISSEMAKAQQIVRRGSERISGLCGRLMCCLAYEADQYREMLEKMPRPGDPVKTKDGNGIVREVNALTKMLKIELENKSILHISIDDL